jgi:hypothetical protein
VDLSERPASPFVRHPWEVARKDFFLAVLAPWTRGAAPTRALDAGAGDGYLASELLSLLPSAARVTCWDAAYTEETLSRLQDRGGQLRFVRSLPEERYDLILLLDILEHVQTEHDFLRALVQRHLSKDGAVLVSVPAWPVLYGSHDVALRHYRRYRPATIRELLESEGLRIHQAGGLFHGLLLARALSRAFEGHRGAPEVKPLQWGGGPLLTRVVSALLRTDTCASAFLSRAGLDAPGLSWWALCHPR